MQTDNSAVIVINSRAQLLYNQIQSGYIYGAVKGTGDGTSINPLPSPAVSYTHLTLPTKRIV